MFLEKNSTHYQRNGVRCFFAKTKKSQNIQRNQKPKLCATAIVHDLILVTRNTKHIDDTSVKLINPFEFQP